MVERDSETDLKEFSKDSSPQKLNYQSPGEEKENENLGNPFPEITVENPKRLNGCELLEQVFPIKRLEKAKLIDMLWAGYPRGIFHRLKQALNQALTLMSLNSLEYNREFDRFWGSFHSRQNWNTVKSRI